MLEIKGDTDHTKLIEMLDALNDESQKIDDVLDTYFDTENLVYWLAFQILTGNCDTQNRNCYLYSPLNSKVWYILDWDNDGMLRKLELSLTGFSDYASWERGASNYWGNVLFNRALRSKSFRSELDRAVKDLRSYLTETRLTKMIKHYREVTESWSSLRPISIICLSPRTNTSRLPRRFRPRSKRTIRASARL